MRQIRTRIRVAGNIAQITGAMEMVAAARLKKAQDRLMGSRPYITSMAGVVADLMASVPPEQRHPLAIPRPVSKVGVLIITGDRGLCGSYNSAVMKLGTETIEETGKDRVALMVLGRRGRTFFRRRGYSLVPLPVEETTQLEFKDAVSIGTVLRNAFLNGEMDRVDVIYTRFFSPLTQRPMVEQLLPVGQPTSDEQNHHVATEYLSEPALPMLTASLLPRYVSARLYYTMLESTASEHGARMTSMSAATDNASKMISSLTLALNRARQAAITKEISEIVSGAEALKG